MVGSPDGGSVFGGARCCRAPTTRRCRTSGTMLRRFGRPESAAADSDPVVRRRAATRRGSPCGSRWSGWLLGVVVGLGLASLMERFAVAERGLLPYVVLSPDRAADRAGAAGRAAGAVRLHDRRADLAAVDLGGGDRGLPGLLPGRGRGAARPAVAGGRIAGADAQLRRVAGGRPLPAAAAGSVPYLLPALRLAAASAVVGAIVAEISTGMPRRDRPADHRVLAAGDRATRRRSWTPILGAAAARACVAGRARVALLDLALRRYRPAGGAVMSGPARVGRRSAG